MRCIGLMFSLMLSCHVYVALAFIAVDFVIPQEVYAQKFKDSKTKKNSSNRKRIVKTTTRNIDKLEHFNRISIAKNINAVIVQGSKQSVQIKAEPTITKEVVCEVKDGRLNVYANKFKYKQSQRIDVLITCDSTLVEIHGVSSSNITTRETLNLSELTLSADYAVEMHITVNTPRLTAEANKFSILWLTGTIGQTNVTLDSGSKLRMKQIRASRVSIIADRESYAEVSALDYLQINADNMSEVQYYAPTAVVEAHTDNGGHVVECMIRDNL